MTRRTDLSLTGRRWVLPSRGTPSPTSLVELLLAGRGFTEPGQRDAYLSPSLASLPDPAHMADMGVASTRLADAIVAGEAMTIYGDYDVDGVCATSLLVEFVRRAGGNARFYIPDRRAEGYGLNLDAVQQVARDTKLLVTADCGIGSYDEIAAARRAGCDVIVVDHHKVPDRMPPATACLNPQRPDCAFPFKGMCAAGVAFMLVCATRRVLRERGAFKARAEPDVRGLLDLVAVATVADMVPLLDVNRTLLTAGLSRLANAPRRGLATLMEVSEVKRATVTSTDIAFRIAPRINARGRMQHAAAAVELMLTDDPDHARTLATALDAANKQRKLVEQQTVEAASTMVERDQLDQGSTLVLAEPSWHPGVLGLVATRLVQRFHRPAIVIGEGGKGSGRSIEGLDLYAAIAAGAGHLERFGGHPAAAGITVLADRLPAFREAFAGAVEAQLGPPPYVPTLRPELELAADGLSLELVDELSRLAPFGQANPEPLLVARGLAVAGKRIIKDRHLKLRLGPAKLDAMAWRLAELLPQVPDAVDVAFRLERNVYNGQERLQLVVEDLRAAEPPASTP